MFFIFSVNLGVKSLKYQVVVGDKMIGNSCNIRQKRITMNKTNEELKKKIRKPLEAYGAGTERKTGKKKLLDRRAVFTHV